MYTSKMAGAGGAARSLLNNFLFVAAIVSIVFFIGSTVYGTCLNFSPVPVIDSWMGMVDFYLESDQGLHVWWEQHNEHRIIFSKVLFWLDMHYFGGAGLMLVPINFALLLLTWWALCNYAGRLIRFDSGRERAFVVAALGMCCLAWMQRQNITFSFQSMFIMVFLLPLCAFYCFARAMDDSDHALRWRAASIALGAASAFCMVNGIFALPLLALMSGFCERSPKRFAAIALCAAATVALFLVGYERSPAGASGIDRLATEPVYVIGFALAYLGSPFYEIFQRLDVAVAAGGIAVALAAYLFGRRAVYRESPYAYALFAFVAFIFATAGVTAIGRQILGFSFAASSRYLTPALMLWAVLLILLLARAPQVARAPAVALILTFALLVPVQMDAFRVDPGMYTPHTKAVAALSLQLDVHDINAKRRLSLFYTEEFEAVFDRAREHRVSIFSDRYAHVATLVGKPLVEAGGEPCAGAVTFESLVDEARAAYKIGGALAEGSKGSYRYVLFGDAQGLVKGVAIPGRDAMGLSGGPGPLNFDGYLFGSADFKELRCIR